MHEELDLVPSVGAREPGARPEVVALLALVVTGLVGVACGQVENAPVGRTASGPEPGAGIVALELGVVSGPDAVPRVQLARRAGDGTVAPLPEAYVDAIEFRMGMVAVTLRRELRLVHHDGSNSLLAREADGLPARAADGSLVYTARFGEVVEIHRLSSLGEDRRLASFRGSATRLAPQADGSIVFVGSTIGGVSGVWIADAEGVRCFTNCELRVGQPWGSGYQAPPGDASRVLVTRDRVEWQTPGGKRETVSREVGR